jgi:hypothetical protein
VCPVVPGAVHRVGAAPALWGGCRGPLQADGKADARPRAVGLVATGSRRSCVAAPRSAGEVFREKWVAGGG